MYFHGDQTQSNPPIWIYRHLKNKPPFGDFPILLTHTIRNSSLLPQIHLQHSWRSVRKVCTHQGRFISGGKNSVLYKDNMGEWEEVFFFWCYMIIISEAFHVYFFCHFIIPSPRSWNISWRQKRTDCAFASQLPQVTIFSHQKDEVDLLLYWNKKQERKNSTTAVLGKVGWLLTPMFTFWKWSLRSINRSRSSSSLAVTMQIYSSSFPFCVCVQCLVCQAWAKYLSLWSSWLTPATCMQIGSLSVVTH